MGVRITKVSEPQGSRISPLLFPELRDLAPKLPFCSAIAEGRHESELILVHHLNSLAAPFVESVSAGYNIRHIIGIPYSSSVSVADDLGNSFKVTVPESMDDIKKIVQEDVKSSNGSIIIEEIGGYTADISGFLDQKKNILGVAEDTN